MSCLRAREIDLAAFRAEPGLPEFEAFARHYPTCAACSREVAAWSALEGALRAAGNGSGEGHPSEERLLAFQDAPQTLDASVRSGVEQHLAGCAQCRSELAVLRSFDLGVLASPAAERAASAGAPLGGRLRAGLTRLAETLFGVPQPALALALLIALAVPAAWLSWRIVGGSREPAIAQRETPAPELIATPAPEPGPELPRVEIARKQPAATPERSEQQVGEPTPQAPVQVAVEPTPERSEQQVGEPTPEPVRVAVEPTPEVPTPESPLAEPMPAPPEPAPIAEPIRIAALLPGELPRYVPDAALVGGSLAPVRVTSVVRAGPRELPRIRALGPEHLGATREASPILYWSLDAATDVPVELTLTSEEAAEPLLELRVTSPGAGIHALALAPHGVVLTPGTTYQWFATLVPDDARRDQDVVSGAGILRAPADAALARRLDEAPRERRAHVLAEAGYWYDAFATVEQWLAAEPDAPRLRAYRDALLRQAELAD